MHSSHHIPLLFSCLLLICCSQEPVTWTQNIQPIVEKRCGECHREGGIGGIVFDEKSSAALAPFMLSEIDSGNMPPWPPGALSLKLNNERKITEEETELLRRWAQNPILGTKNPLAKPEPPQSSRTPSTAPTFAAAIPAYLPAPVRSDQIRCFIIEAPAGWIRAYSWSIQSPKAIHHVAADIIDEAFVPLLRSKEGVDGPGFDCSAGVSGLSLLASLSNTSIGPDNGFAYPEGWGIKMPPKGILLLSLHYQPWLLQQPDKSGINLWYSDVPLRPVALNAVGAPTELPCPTGIAAASNDPCSREHAALDSLITNPIAYNDSLLKNCGKSLHHLDLLPYSNSHPEHFYVDTSCAAALNASGRLLSVRIHAHTRTVSARLEIGDGLNWRTILDIPRWRWTWESAYQVSEEFYVNPNQLLRVSCQLDNGWSAQWSSATKQPWHDYVPINSANLEPAQYRFDNGTQSGEMCWGSVEIAQ